MEAIFKKTEGDYLEATLEINGQEIIAMDEFGGKDLKPGDVVSIELAVGLAYDEEEQNSMLDSNLNAEKKLEHQKGWSYRAYGWLSASKMKPWLMSGYVNWLHHSKLQLLVKA
jgi:predicted 3-demethylubiquinone-9 3-methyltransferase (glyoxalase superfamily)